MDLDYLADDNSYVMVRCPFKVTNKLGKTFTCSTPVNEVIPPARGRGYCRNCKKKFNYEISSQKRYNVQTMIVAKPVRKPL